MIPTEIKGLWYDAAKHEYWMQESRRARSSKQKHPSMPGPRWCTQVASVTSILARADLSDISRVPEEALRRGTAVHWGCECEIKAAIKGQLCSYDFGERRRIWYENEKGERFSEPNQPGIDFGDECHKYILGLKRFLADLRWKPLHSERVVMSRRHWYCGRMDAVFELPSQKKRKKNVLVDIKTNTQPEHVGVQLAAYRWAAIESKIPIHSAVCLVLTPNSYRLWDHDKEGAPKEDWIRFREALTKG